MSELKNRKKSKGSIMLLSDIVTAVLSMFSTLFLLFVAALIVFIVQVRIGGVVYGDLLYDTPASGVQLLALSDMEHEGYKMKNLFTYSAWAGNETFSMDGKEINLKTATLSAIKKLKIEHYRAFITIGGKEIYLAQSGAIDPKQLKCSEEIFRAGGKEAIVKLCTGLIREGGGSVGR